MSRLVILQALSLSSLTMYSGHLILVCVQNGEPGGTVTVFTLTMYSGHQILARVQTGDPAGAVTLFTMTMFSGHLIPRVSRLVNMQALSLS
ncbi:hypothetical protein NDU88_006813 [Pleurodeles waltl]|uniref:Secreted protein n=1 Tax=Pleurodeles waltl TaxID=8319 RepID=A0AAV7L598_PLEWA|nr:hypothetical protein NDU88_006813 [Pleurodeles waltl]